MLYSRDPDVGSEIGIEVESTETGINALCEDEDCPKLASNQEFFSDSDNNINLVGS